MRYCILLILFSGIYTITNAQWKKVFLSTSQDLYDVQLLNQYAFVAGNNSTLLKSVDSGKSWKNMVLTIPENLRAVCFLDSNIGLVIGENARVQKTIDGGKNWSSKYVRTAAYGYDIAFLNNRGVAVGNDMLAISTSDFGESWSVDTTLQKFKNLNSVAVSQNGDCWAVGDSGYMLHKNIAAKRWKIIKYPTKINLNHVSYLGDKTIVVAGGMPDSAVVGKFYNILLISSDSGKTWQQNTIGEMKIINSAFFRNSDTGFLAGSNGLISQCRNGVSDRGLQLTGTSSSLNKIFFLEKTGIAVGDGGALLRTVNSGGKVLLEKKVVANSEEYSIFPNPCRKEFYVHVAKGKIFEIRVINSQGQEVCRESEYSGLKTIAVIQPGMYSIVISDGMGALSVRRLLVLPE